MGNTDQKSIEELWIDFRSLDGLSQVEVALELGHRLLDSEENEKALGIGEFIISFAESIDDNSLQIEGHIIAARASSHLHEYKLQLEHFGWLIERQSKDDDLLGAAGNTLAAAHALIGLGQVSEALKSLEDMLPVAEGMHNVHLTIQYFHAMYKCHEALKDFAAMETTLQSALQYAIDEGVLEWVVRFRHLLGKLHMRWGREQQARILWRDTFHAALMAGDDVVVYELAVDLGKAYLKVRERELARDIVDIGIMTAERNNEWKVRVELHALYAKIMLDLFDDADQAREHAAKARAICEVHKYPDDKTEYDISKILLESSTLDFDLTAAAYDNIQQLRDREAISYSDFCWAAYFVYSNFKECSKDKLALGVIEEVDRRLPLLGRSTTSHMAFTAFSLLVACENGERMLSDDLYRAINEVYKDSKRRHYRHKFITFALAVFDEKWVVPPSVSAS